MIKFFADILAFNEKEIALMTRFKIGFLLESFVGPLSRIIPIFLIYYGFWNFAGAEQFGEITQETYIVFLSAGMFVFTVFSMGCISFVSRFGAEKYWKTIDALFISPTNIFSYVIGIGLSEIIRNLPAILLFLAITFIVKPISLPAFVAVIAIMLMVYAICLAFGLIWGSIFLSKEGFSNFFAYANMGWNLFSCFYYPLTIFPTDFAGLINLRLIAEINPVFQALDLVRTLWVNGTIELLPLAYVLGFAMILQFIAAYLFKRSWKKLGVEGY